MKSNLVSVMIPCHNSAQSLAKALASLLAQSHRDWEALVVDDGSTDRPEEIVNQFQDPRIRFYRFPENRGRAQARQFALENTQGEFLTMLDADDWLMPTKLAKQIEVLRSHPDIALVSSAMYMENSNGKLMGVARFNQNHGNAVCPPLGLPRSLPIAHAPIMVRMAIAKTRKYDSTLSVSEDLDFFLPILMSYSYAQMAEPLYVYSYESNRSGKKHRAQLKAHRYIFRKFFRSYPFITIWRVCLTYFKIGLAPLMRPLLGNRGISPPYSNETLSFENASQVLARR